MKSTLSVSGIEILEARIAPAALIGLDDKNHLLLFDSATPGTVVTTTVTGLGAGETLVGIDFRPATGLLYGLAATATGHGSVYLINPATGVATFSATLTADPADVTSPYTGLNGSSFGVDFNPVSDRLRVVSDQNQDLRINVDGGLVTTDADLNPPGSSVGSSAYTSSFAGATGTTLYGIDVASDRLVVQNPPNNGTLTPVGSLGVNANGVAGFDIITARTSSGVIAETAYAAMTVGGVTGLYNINLNSGAANALGVIGTGASLVGLTAVVGTPAATAFTIDGANHLIRFNTATPGLTTDLGAISGIPGAETILGIDVQTSTGVLYALSKSGSVGRVYSINTSTSAATLVSTLSADLADLTAPYAGLSGTEFGVDFDPKSDRLRVTSDLGQNLRVNTQTGFAITDANLNPGTPHGVAAAYTNNFAHSGSSQLYIIDDLTDHLYLQIGPSGILVDVGALGVNTSAVAGFDIRSNNDAYATLTVAGVTGLYNINLSTGAATAVGMIGSAGATYHGLALASNGTLQFNPPAIATVGEGAVFGTFTVSRIGGSDGTVSIIVQTHDNSAIAGSDYTAVSQVLTFGPGVTTMSFDVPITNDTAFELNEAFTAVLSGAGGAGAVDGSFNTVTITIQSDDPIPPSTLYALGAGDVLTSFSSSSPGTILTSTAVTGLGNGEHLVGIDFRPANGGLYGLATTSAGAGKIYLIDPRTGAASFSASLSADPADATAPFTSISGSNFGVDFNPVVDRLRVVSGSGLNLRINVDTGLVTTDTDINPAGVSIAGSAYLGSYAGFNTTTLYGVDVSNDQVVIQSPPNNGTIVSVGPLGVDASGVGGFDIRTVRLPNGTNVDVGYATLTVGGATGLYTIDLVSGAATLVGSVGNGAAATAGLTAALPAPAAKAFTIDSSNHLLTFDTATPGATANASIVGLSAGETVIGFDFRPSSGAACLVTKDSAGVGHLYTLNTATAQATLRGTLVADPADASAPYTLLSGTGFDVDFNPVADRLRLVSNSGQSLDINVDTLQVTTDAAVSGTANGVAHGTNVAGASSTTLFDLDAGTDKLYVQNTTTGALAVVGSLGVDASAVAGFDIRSNGDAYALLTVNGVTLLFGIDLTTGAATEAGHLGTDGSAAVTGFALSPSGTLSFSASASTVNENAGFATITVNRVGGSDGVASVVLKTAGGSATTGQDFGAADRVVTFAAGETVKSITVPVVNDMTYEGSEGFTVSFGNVLGGAGLSGPTSSAITIVDDDPIPSVSISDVTAVEGNSGVRHVTLNVSLSGETQAPVTLNYHTSSGTGADGAIAGEDFTAIASQQLVFAPGQVSKTITVDVLSDTIGERNETFTVDLADVSANATFAKSSGTATIVNDDLTSIKDGRTVTYTDGDGDIVTLKITKGTLTADNFAILPVGTHGGVQVAALDISDSQFANAGVTFSAKRSAEGGDGFVNVGYINATGHALGSVLVSGDLGRIDAGPIKSLTIGSAGVLDTTTQLPGGTLTSNITGKLAKLLVRGDVDGAEIKIAGDAGSIVVNGSIRGGALPYSGSIQADGRIASLNVLGSIEGGSGATSGLIAAHTIGAAKVRGDIDGGHLFILGNDAPKTTSAALALKSLTVSGSVRDAEILVGADRDGQGINADVQVGTVKAASWVASDLAVGVHAGLDGYFGTDDDRLNGTNGTIVSRIASVIITGQVFGNIASDTDHFGFVAEQIGSFKTGATKLPLDKTAGSAPDQLTIGSTGDVMLREIAL